MLNHGIVPLNGFYEWVEPQQSTNEKSKVKMIYFYPRHTEMMWAPCLWDEWTSRDGKVKFISFAIITDGPPKEIESMGHDRCPIFLKADEVNVWLNPQKHSKKSIYEILQKREEVYYDYQWA
jgi:putative SOS response-associated peptidase YedK